MEVSDHIDILALEGKRFLSAAMAAGTGAPVPTCPEWTVLQLVQHLGAVHRWAGSIVAQQLASRPEHSVADEIANAPSDDTVLGWFEQGHAVLVASLRSSSPTADFWRFTRDAPSSLAFWARRQAHETTIHRVDAEGAAGRQPTPATAQLAADGIDEFFAVFGRRETLRPGIERTFTLAATDSPRVWRVTFGNGPVVTADGRRGDDAHLLVEGRTDHLYRLVWNRADTGGLVLHGDDSVLAHWRAAAAGG